jgi:integrase
MMGTKEDTPLPSPSARIASWTMSPNDWTRPALNNPGSVRKKNGNFLRGTLRVERQRDSRRAGFIPPKTRGSVRTVPLGRVVVSELAAHLAAHGPAADGSIFTDEFGQPLTYTGWKRAWRLARTTYKTHDLRHYAASALIAGERQSSRCR